MTAPDLSPKSKKNSARWGTFAQTWITWKEIKTITWDEDAVDGRPHRYVRAGDRRLVLSGKAAPIEGNLWRVKRISRREVLNRSLE